MKSVFSYVFLTSLLLWSTYGQRLLSTPERRKLRHANRRRGDCGTDPLWQPNISAWTAADTDAQLERWWASVTANRPQSLDNALGRQYGGHVNDFRCGIDHYSTCSAQGCSGSSYKLLILAIPATVPTVSIYSMLNVIRVPAFQQNEDPAWAYLAFESLVHLNTLFNSIYVGLPSPYIGSLNAEQRTDMRALVGRHNQRPASLPWRCGRDGKPLFPVEGSTLPSR